MIGLFVKAMISSVYKSVFLEFEARGFEVWTGLGKFCFAILGIGLPNLEKKEEELYSHTVWALDATFDRPASAIELEGKLQHLITVSLPGL